MTHAELLVSDLTMEYRTAGYSVLALDHLSMEASPGELVVLLGPSGSGKTTLLSCLGGLLRPTSGSIHLAETDVTELEGRALDAYRRGDIGFVFQAFNLIPSLSARENVAVPAMFAGASKRTALADADDLLEKVGLADRAGHRPAHLSGGQQQRVAIARGLIGRPRLLLADEPTANLDHVQAETVIRLLLDLRDEGRMLVVSTHDARLLPIADRVVEMISSDRVVSEPIEVSYLRGEMIFAQGDQADLVYVIEKGTVEIVRPLTDGGEELLAELEPGQYFGELGALLGFPRSATARAGTDIELRAMSPDVFRREVTAPGVAHGQSA